MCRATAPADIRIDVVDSKQVPDEPDISPSICSGPAQQDPCHALRTCGQVLTQKAVFGFGTDFSGEGRGPVGNGLLPVIRTPDLPRVDSLRSGFEQGSLTNARLRITNVDADSTDVRRPGYPNDFRITFGAVPTGYQYPFHLRRSDSGEVQGGRAGRRGSAEDECLFP